MKEVGLRRVAILGSTGSVGRQALQVMEAHPDVFELSVITGYSNHELLIAQARKYKPETVVIANEKAYLHVKVALTDLPIKVFAGAEAIEQVVQEDNVDVVLTAMVGFAGLRSTMKAIEAGKVIALANKETLVVAGELIQKLAIEKKASILPVDSEHSAIFQCLVGENHNPVEKVILTASGGPFRGYSRAKLQAVTPAQALKHPNWNMGRKISIDSATMMNKGLEVIEAKWLFGLEPEQIEVVIHPQSIIHSMVQFRDGSIKAQMGMPDMRLPIQYALGFPYRLPSELPRFSFADCSTLSFEKPDIETFPCLALAYKAMSKGGNAACILNAANEYAVEAFLQEEISFPEIAELIEESMESVPFIKEPTLEDYIETDRETRERVRELRIKN